MNCSEMAFPAGWVAIWAEKYGYMDEAGVPDYTKVCENTFKIQNENDAEFELKKPT
eukprot:COSAG06_NODE_594_length_13939_cov_45.080202_7_plen_56_part_00